MDIPEVTFEEIAHNPGYNCGRPSMRPFSFIEARKVFKGRLPSGRKIEVALIAFGAYDAFGLIGPEKGGLAFVAESPERAVLATRDIPYDMARRKSAFDALATAATAEELRDAIKAHEGWDWR